MLLSFVVFLLLTGGDGGCFCLSSESSSIYTGFALIILAPGMISETLGTRGFFEAAVDFSILVLSYSAGVGDYALARSSSGTVGTLGFFSGAFGKSYSCEAFNCVADGC